MRTVLMLSLVWGFYSNGWFEKMPYIEKTENTYLGDMKTTTWKIKSDAITKRFVRVTNQGT